jgi:tetratricopeptide (TPR) repeat protein
VYLNELAQVEKLVRDHHELSRDQAIALCSTNLENETIDLFFVLWYCQLMRQSNQPEEINKRAMHWLHSFPDSVALVHEICWSWLDADENFKAERLIRAALKVHGDELMLWCDLASVMISKNQLDEANECAEYVLARDPRFSEALRIKARIAIKNGQQEVALDAVNQSLMEEPRNVDGLIMRGIIEDFGTDKDKLNTIAKANHAWVNGMYILFVVGKNLCGIPGALLWLACVVIRWYNDSAGRLDNWRDWIITPQALMLMGLLGWALMIGAGSLIHHRLKTKELPPLWRFDWIWTVVPILTWLLFTSLRYLMDEGQWSFAMDFIRSLAFCSIFPIYLWRRLRTEHRLLAKIAWFAWLTIVGLFAAGLVFTSSYCFGIGYYFSAAITLIYICFRGRW